MNFGWLSIGVSIFSIILLILSKIVSIFFCLSFLSDGFDLDDVLEGAGAETRRHGVLGRFIVQREHPIELERIGRGNNGNLIARNDFSHAVAHGLELTFSFGNHILENRLIGNGICGIWGGYSRDTQIAGNLFSRNGMLNYGLEGGGINIEHGQRIGEKDLGVWSGQASDFPSTADRGALEDDDRLQ